MRKGNGARRRARLATPTERREFVRTLAERGVGPLDAVLKVMGAVAARSIGMTRMEFAREIAIRGICAALNESGPGFARIATRDERVALAVLGLDMDSLRAACGDDLAIEGVLTDAVAKSALSEAQAAMRRSA